MVGLFIGTYAVMVIVIGIVQAISIWFGFELNLTFTVVALSVLDAIAVIIFTGRLVEIEEQRDAQERAVFRVISVSVDEKKQANVSESQVLFSFEVVNRGMRDSAIESVYLNWGTNNNKRPRALPMKSELVISRQTGWGINDQAGDFMVRSGERVGFVADLGRSIHLPINATLELVPVLGAQSKYKVSLDKDHFSLQLIE